MKSLRSLVVSHPIYCIPRLNSVNRPVKCSFHKTTGISRVSTGLYLRCNLKQIELCGDRQRLQSIHGDDAHRSADLSSSPMNEGSWENNGRSEGKSSSSIEILEKLRRYGLSGILSYGLVNTVYYLVAFLVAWFYIAPAPGKLGYWEAFKRFLKLMAMVWAGSQVTKLVRAAGALALAPAVDIGLSWVVAKFNFESRGKAFAVIVGCCFGLAAVLFTIVTLLWV